MIFLVFFGEQRFDEHTRAHLHESPRVVWVPLVLLAIPSLCVGAMFAGPMLFGDFFIDSIYVKHDPLEAMASHWHGPVSFALHGFQTRPFALAMAGVAAAAGAYLIWTAIPASLARRSGIVYRALVNKYWFDDVNQTVFAGGARATGQALWRVGDVGLIDGLFVNGTAHAVGFFARLFRRIQTGLLYHYAFAMILGLLGLLGYFVHGWLS